MTEWLFSNGTYSLMRRGSIYSKTKCGAGSHVSTNIPTACLVLLFIHSLPVVITGGMGKMIFSSGVFKHSCFWQFHKPICSFIVVYFVLQFLWEEDLLKIVISSSDFDEWPKWRHSVNTLLLQFYGLILWEITMNGRVCILSTFGNSQYYMSFHLSWNSYCGGRIG
jgi:hypothetical protein